MRVVPGSHTRLYPVAIDRTLQNKSFAKHNTLRLADYEKLEATFDGLGLELGGIEPGDVVLIHSLLVHRSGRNTSDRCRWVFNPRFGDFVDPAMVRRHWRTARASAPFIVDQIHPEAVVEEDHSEGVS
jgi:ectoine hydroxylase-related dioxygenase (phytanoyl-CoA dioxygenase family)